MLIEPPLTGRRTYLHGADILDALVAATGAEGDLALVLRIAGDCAIEALPEMPADGRPVCGRFRYVRNGIPHRLSLHHRPDRPIRHRRTGDDAALLEGAVLAGDRATQPAGPGTPLHRAIALALALLERPYPDDYWTIAEIACATLPPADGTVAVRTVPRLGGRFWRAEIAVDRRPLGHVLLARGSPRR
ncbi:hypothetical protein [Stella sp.]|uniref:hypothetical protein n=1 Tax=Stella sp. TaxID=2912054 RepID=UPI0035B17444